MKKDKKILVEPSTCPKCGKAFQCSTSSKCWCYEIDVPPDKMEFIEKEYNSCLCPNCLREYAR